MLEFTLVDVPIAIHDLAEPMHLPILPIALFDVSTTSYKLAISMQNTCLIQLSLIDRPITFMYDFDIFAFKVYVFIAGAEFEAFKKVLISIIHNPPIIIFFRWQIKLSQHVLSFIQQPWNKWRIISLYKRIVLSTLVIEKHEVVREQGIVVFVFFSEQVVDVIFDSKLFDLLLSCEFALLKIWRT